MTPPTWLDASGRRQPLACWPCGREVAPMRFCAADLRRQGRRPSQKLQIPGWCGCTTDTPDPDDLATPLDAHRTTAVGASRPLVGDGHLMYYRGTV
jgi:hypothetical protein